ncbi:hypothetical protein C9374_007542 [Naegleria lovaniensis]|uniref:Transmembrane protein n=1 Tax=Naegleria lovaniensis TaxID=51637 RepID=A0AA88GN89_NAELO|nr:uncharacterized protein C9374_007542 [Naegleria lovaniensis]KAG2379403.1 hypothetical protein C9374_007542 [Naegleria lovaniensis]
MMTLSLLSNSLCTFLLILLIFFTSLTTLVNSHPLTSLSPNHRTTSSLLNLPVRVLSLQELQPSHVIVGAFNYYSLFVWKKLKIESFPQLFETVMTNSNWTTRYFNQNMNHSTNSNSNNFPNFKSPHRPFKIICPQNYPCQNLWQLTWTHSVSNPTSNFALEHRYSLFSDCRYGSLLEYGDAFLMTPFDFAMIVRVNLQVTQKGLFSSRQRPLQVPFEWYNPLVQLQIANSSILSMYNPSDFIAIPIIPSKFIVLDQGASGMTFDSTRTCEESFKDGSYSTSCTFLQLAMKHTRVRSMSSCSESTFHDMYVWDGLHGLLNFSQHDIELVQKLLNFQVQVDDSLIREAWSSLDSDRAKSLETLSHSTISNLLWNSTCHYCSTTLCVSENIERTDYFVIVYSIFMCGYYLLFFGFRMYRLPSMKRRLLLPFVTPFALLLFQTSWSSVVRNACGSVMLPISILIVGFIFTLHVVIVLRNLYLKILYKFLRQENSKNLSQTKEKHYKFYKILASERMGWFMCTAIPLSVMLVFSIPSTVVSSVLFTELVLANRIMFATIALFGCVLALLYLVIDILICRKKVFKKGIRWFFFFDDPLYIRIDLLSLQLLMILLIIYLILLPLNAPFYPVSDNFATNAFLRMLICIFLMMSSGGFTMTIELVNLILAKKTDAFIIDSVKSLEYLLLKYSCFEELLKDYCTGELTLEHLLFFKELSEIKTLTSSKISQSMFERLERVFIEKYAIFQVDLPKKTISQFYKMKEKMKQVVVASQSGGSGNSNEESPTTTVAATASIQKPLHFPSFSLISSGQPLFIQSEEIPKNNHSTSTSPTIATTIIDVNNPVQNNTLSEYASSPNSPIPQLPNKEDLKFHSLNQHKHQQPHTEWILSHQLNTQHKSSNKLEQSMTILFEQLFIDVVFNIREIFSRFKTTKEFRDWVEKMSREGNFQFNQPVVVEQEVSNSTTPRASGAVTNQKSHIKIASLTTVVEFTSSRQ